MRAMMGLRFKAAINTFEKLWFFQMSRNVNCVFLVVLGFHFGHGCNGTKGNGRGKGKAR